MAEGAKKISLCQILECPICLDYFEKPIRQCVRGHSFCSKCIHPQYVKSCPECRAPISDARSFALEQLIENMDFPCENCTVGCKYKLNKQQMAFHEQECQYRNFKCEGKNFCNWTCIWEGRNVLKHFKEKHSGHTSLQFNSSISIGYNATSNFNDIQLISAHYQLFFYKHCIDVQQGKAFWAFQMIGPKTRAEKFYYEFEIFMEPPAIRKFKITEQCENDTEDIKKIFESEKCVVISLKALKLFINNKNEYNIRFRIMKMKKDLTRTTIKSV